MLTVRIRSVRCARAASGHAIAALPKSVMMSRLRICHQNRWLECLKPTTLQPDCECEMQHNRP